MNHAADPDADPKLPDAVEDDLGDLPMPEPAQAFGGPPVAASAALGGLGDLAEDEALEGVVVAAGEGAAAVGGAATLAPVKPWAERLVKVLDDGIRIPGTDFGFGVDAIAGFLFPGAGDAITGASSLTLLVLALKERVPTVILVRMLINIAVDTLLGTIPVVGDIFDLFWRANRKNIDLIKRYRHRGEEPGTADYAIAAIGMLFAVATIVLPFVWFYVFGASLATLLGAMLGAD